MTRVTGGHRVGSGLAESHRLLHSCPFQVVPRICPSEQHEDRPHQGEAGVPHGKNLRHWALQSSQALALEARRAWVARRAEELEWELSLLVQVAAGSRLSLGRR